MTTDRARFSFAELPDGAVLSGREVAQWLGVSVRQVQRCGCPYIDLGARSRRYLVRDVRLWLEAHRTAAAGRHTGLVVQRAGVTP